jgi:hypothetical protein
MTLSMIYGRISRSNSVHGARIWLASNPRLSAVTYHVGVRVIRYHEYDSDNGERMMAKTRTGGMARG